MKKKQKARTNVSPEDHMRILMSSLDQDNFDDAMPRELLEEFIRDQGGDPEAIWTKLGPWIEGLLAERARKIAR